jgi:hypothetical protein
MLLWFKPCFEERLQIQVAILILIQCKGSDVILIHLNRLLDLVAHDNSIKQLKSKLSRLRSKETQVDYLVC